jgi:8-oxo-dGTP pyrophosphatase MutT (NUDIX family)
MFVKIYFNDKPLFLCNDIDETIQPIIHHDDAVFIDELDSHAVKTMIHEMQLPQVHAGVYFHNDLEELIKEFTKKFSVVKAAGGLVENKKKNILMIFRRGRWDLPKGKLDKGETLEACAIREVEEETGLRNIKLLGPLTITYHTYHEGTKFILKESHWFRMQVTTEQKLVPQTNEDIQQIQWVNLKDLEKYLKNSYPMISDIIETYFKKTSQLY